MASGIPVRVTASSIPVHPTYGYLAVGATVPLGSMPSCLENASAIPCWMSFADNFVHFDTAHDPPLTLLLPSSRHQLSYDDYLEDNRENYRKCSVLCCVRQLCTHIWTVFKDECWFKLRFSFYVCLGLAYWVFFWSSLDYFVLVLFAFVVFGLVSSVLCQEIGWEERLRKWPFSRQWVIKP